MIQKVQYYAKLDAVKLAIDSAIAVIQCPMITSDGSVMDEPYRISDSNIKLANISLAKAQRTLHGILDTETIELSDTNDND